MQFAQNIRYALRRLRRSPGFALTAMLTLALGIGATVAVFSVVEQMLLTQLPYPHAKQIIALRSWNASARHLNRSVPGGDYQDMHADAVFAATAWVEGGAMGVQLPHHAAFTQISAVSPDFFRVFEMQPIRGADFRTADASHQAIVSADFADAELGGPDAALGKVLSVEGRPMQVVGVMPRGFDFPAKTSIWMGMPATPDNVNRDSYNYRAVARVRDGSDVHRAQLHLDALSRRLAAQFPLSHAHVQLRAVPLRDSLTGEVRTSLWLWLAAVGVLLLIACANVAHLQLVSITAQSHAIAVRAALGATRARIVGGVFLEAAVIAVLGGLAGLAVSVPATALLMRLLAAELPRAMRAAPDLRLLAVSILLAFCATVVSALAPCWWAAKRDPTAALQGGVRTGTGSRRAALGRRGLLALEIALSFVLVTTSGLLLRTLEHVRDNPLGFAHENRLVVYAHAPANGLEQAKRRVIELARLTEQLRTLPGVQAAAQGVGLPAGQYGSSGSYALPDTGQSFTTPGLANAQFALAAPGYFSAMRIPLLRGREISSADVYGSEPIAEISASLAQISFGKQNPLGQRIICGWDEDSSHPATIVGVVGDVRQDSPADDPGPTLYMALAQHPYLANEVQIVLVTASAPASLIPVVRQRVLAADASIATKFTTMDDALASATEPERLRGELVAAFAALALLLAAVGMYSVTSYTVAQQVREIGIRMALGADRAAVAREVMAGAAGSGLLGIVLGVLLSAASARLLARFLVGVPATDLPSYAVAAVVLLATAAAAALVPARRAASTDPMVALRTE